MMSVSRMAVVVGCVSMLFISFTASAQHVPPRTQTVHSIEDFTDLQPPTIDGVFDADEAWVVSSQAGSSANVSDRSFWMVQDGSALDPTDLVPSGVVEGSDAPADSSDGSFRVWTLFDDQYLYVAVEVLDDANVNRVAAGTEDTSANGTLQNEDSVEIYIDGDHSLSPANLTRRAEEYATGGQFVLSSVNAWRDVDAGGPVFGPEANADWYGQAFDNAAFTGFVYEFRFKLSKIGNPEAGDSIGFNIAVNDSDDSSVATRRYQLRWVGATFDESTYGDLYFGRREITAPLITGTITIDGNLNEAAWQSAGQDEMNPNVSPFWMAAYPKDAADHSATLYVMHDSTNLYIACEIRDDIVKTDAEAGSVGGELWNDDSVEFMIDGDLSRTAGNENVPGASAKFNTASNGAQLFDVDNFPIGDNATGDWFSAATSSATGYIIELRALKTAVLEPDNTALFGLGTAINEDDGLGNEGFQMDWEGTPNNERSYGNIRLGGAVVEVRNWDLH